MFLRVTKSAVSNLAECQSSENDNVNVGSCSGTMLTYNSSTSFRPNGNCHATVAIWAVAAQYQALVELCHDHFTIEVSLKLGGHQGDITADSCES